MQNENEKDFFYRCKKFVCIQDFVKVFLKKDGASLVLEVLNNIVYLCLKRYNNFLL